MTDSQTTLCPASGQRGVFITIEGGDGAGKTTQAARLVSYLEQQGHDVCPVHEPGGTELGEHIRSILLDNRLGEIDPVAELLLYEAARAQIVTEVIVPALESGKLVVCDRFADSTTAYQGYGRELDVALVDRINAIASQGVCPDCTVLLALDPATGLARAASRMAGADRMERAGGDFHERVYAGFAHIADRCEDRICIVDASGTAEQVHESVIAALSDALPAVFAPEGGRVS